MAHCNETETTFLIDSLAARSDRGTKQFRCLCLLRDWYEGPVQSQEMKTLVHIKVTFSK